MQYSFLWQGFFFKSKKNKREQGMRRVFIEKKKLKLKLFFPCASFFPFVVIWQRSSKISIMQKKTEKKNLFIITLIVIRRFMYYNCIVKKQFYLTKKVKLILLLFKELAHILRLMIERVSKCIRRDIGFTPVNQLQILNQRLDVFIA